MAPMLLQMQLKKLSDNGMALPTLACWFAYCLAHTVPLEDSRARQAPTPKRFSLK